MTTWTAKQKSFLHDHKQWTVSDLAYAMGRTEKETQKQLNSDKGLYIGWDVMRARLAKALGVKLRNPLEVQCSIFVDDRLEFTGDEKQCMRYLDITLPYFWKIYWSGGLECDLGFVKIYCSKYD